MNNPCCAASPAAAPSGGLSTLHSPQQCEAPSLGSERCLFGITGDVPLPQRGKLLLALIPTGYNAGDNEDQTGSARLAGKHTQGLLSQQRFFTSHLKNYPRDSLPCQTCFSAKTAQVYIGAGRIPLAWRLLQTLRDFPLWLNSVQT